MRISNKKLLIGLAIAALIAVPALLQKGAEQSANPFPENQAVQNWQLRLCGGTPHSQAEALSAAQAAVVDLDADAAFALAQVYLTGICLPRDEEQAVTLLHLAAANGSQEARRLLEQREADQARLYPAVDSLEQ